MSKLPYEVSAAPTDITLGMLDMARERLLPLVHQPGSLESIEGLDELLPFKVLFHPEFRHTNGRTGSFKDNGATYKIVSGEDSGDLSGNDIIAISSGNHAIAVSKAASGRGYNPLIVMAETTSPLKVQEARDFGAQVFTDGVTIFNRIGLFEALAIQTGRYKVPAFDDVTIATGHGAGAGLTLVEHLNQRAHPVDTILVPVGGGGLIAGIGAAVAHRLDRPARVIGVEPEDAADGGQSFKAGHIIALKNPSRSIADGIQTQKLGESVFPIIQKYVGGFAPGVPEQYTMLAHQIMTRAFARDGEQIEPTSAVPLGALLQDYNEGTDLFEGDVAIIISGGNWSPEHIDDAYKAQLASLRDDLTGSRLDLSGPVSKLLPAA